MKTFLPPLTPQDEKEYLEKMRAGDENARKLLIERNLRLVAHVCKKYQNVSEDMEDLISIGSIGLIKAVMTFDHEKGNRLGTYAARCIDNELLMYLRFKKKSSKEISLYEPIGTDKEGNQIHLLDIVEGEEVDVVEAIELNGNIKKLYEYIPKILNKREQEIIRLRYGLYHRKPKTQREIADRIGISRSYVSRIEKKALRKLKEHFEKATRDKIVV
ncbi:RNA polymerase sigma-28 factor [Clostridia bacterium]|nr:RNA polymerase sigma-28 factor [Clostridia bacterium]